MSRTLAAALAAFALLVTACGAGAPPRSPEAAARPAPDPAADPADGAPPDDLVDEPGAATSEAAQPAIEVTLTVPVGRLPDGTAGAVTIRTVEAGGRRELVVDTPAGVVDRHVMTEDEHWWWITPLARHIADVEWIHIDLRDVEAGGDLPGPVADARVPLPEPGELAAGVVLADREVRAVTPVGPDEDRIDVEGLDEPVVLRRRRLPAGTAIELPRDATSLRDLPGTFGR